MHVFVCMCVCVCVCERGWMFMCIIFYFVLRIICNRSLLLRPDFPHTCFISEVEFEFEKLKVEFEFQS